MGWHGCFLQKQASDTGFKLVRRGGGRRIGLGTCLLQDETGPQHATLDCPPDLAQASRTAGRLIACSGSVHTWAVQSIMHLKSLPAQHLHFCVLALQPQGLASLASSCGLPPPLTVGHTSLSQAPSDPSRGAAVHCWHPRTFAPITPMSPWLAPSHPADETPILETPLLTTLSHILLHFPAQHTST